MFTTALKIQKQERFFGFLQVQHIFKDILAWFYQM